MADLSTQARDFKCSITQKRDFWWTKLASASNHNK